jgi:hypothetical protein
MKIINPVWSEKYEVVAAKDVVPGDIVQNFTFAPEKLVIAVAHSWLGKTRVTLHDLSCVNVLNDFKFTIWRRCNLK